MTNLFVIIAHHTSMTLRKICWLWSVKKDSFGQKTLLWHLLEASNNDCPDLGGMHSLMGKCLVNHSLRVLLENNLKLLENNRALLVNDRSSSKTIKHPQ